MAAAIYCRISDDTEGEALGVKRQEADCRALCERNDWPVGQVFVDNDISASTRSKRVRPEYADMLSRAAAGEFDHIVAYSNSRLTRRPVELEELIDLYESTGTVVATVVSGQDDLSTADGRMVARIKAGVDAAEAERTGERVARRLLENRRNGRAHGGRPIFGYANPDAGKGIGYMTHLDASETAALRDAAQMVLAGASLTEVQKKWNASGVTTKQGKPWTNLTNVRRTMTNPRIAGLVTHKGGVVGEGDWPAVLDRRTFEAVCEAVAPKVRRPGATSRKYLLSGFVYCANCGHKMDPQVTHGKNSRNRYLCYSARGGCGKVARHMPWLEDVVITTVTAALRDDNPQVEADSLSADVESLDDEIAALEGKAAEYREGFTAGVFDMADLAAELPKLRERVNALKRERAEVVRRVASLAAADEADLSRWLDTDPESLSVRRAILARYVSRVMVKPLPKGKAWGASTPLPLDSVQIIPA
jgi:DNA invertase Pin-like site-specific DNA recombinase